MRERNGVDLFVLLCGQMMIGAEFVLKQSKMSASVDCNGKVDSTLEVCIYFCPVIWGCVRGVYATYISLCSCLTMRFKVCACFCCRKWGMSLAMDAVLYKYR